MKLAIVSNADGSVEAQLAADSICQMGPGPGVEMDAILDSSVVGVAKPDPRIFEIALDRLGGIDPSRAIHVGDTPAADCTGAQAAGITPILIDPHNDHEDFNGLRLKSFERSRQAARRASVIRSQREPRAWTGRAKVAGPLENPPRRSAAEPSSSGGRPRTPPAP